MTNTATCALLLLAMCATPIAAQRTWSHACLDRRDDGRFFLAGGSLGSATWRWTIGGIESSGDLALPAGDVGSAALVNANTLLVSGWNVSDGWLAEIVFSSSGSAVTPVMATVPIGIDVVQMTFLPSAGLVVGIEYATRELVAASYASGLQVGPWSTIATPTQCSLLNINSGFLSLDPLNEGVGFVLSAGEPFDGEVSWHVTRDASGLWGAVRESEGAPPLVLRPTWFVSAYPVLTANSTMYELWVGGGAGYFSIVTEDTGDAVFVGNHLGDPDGQVFSIPYGALELGRLYRVECVVGDAFDASMPFRAETVWPRVSLDPNMVPSKVGIRSDFPAVGMDFVSWELYWASAQPQPSDPMLLTMTVGAWDFGINPTVQALGVDILAAPFGDLGVQAALWENRGRVSFGWAFAVNNPVLAGLRVAMQAVGVLPTGQFIVSDVVGVQLVE